MTVMVKPDSDFCYAARVFTEGKQCPDLDDSTTTKPMCKKCGKALPWTVSGVVLKCDECRREDLCPA